MKREGFRTVTAYITVTNAEGLIEFLKKTFDAEEVFRTVGSAGGVHCELRLGDSMLMVGASDSRPMAFHVYVKDIDATYARALELGAVSLQAPADQEWGERTGNVKDPYGNFWYIATAKGENYYSEGAPTVQPYLHPVRSGPMVDFLIAAFGAVEQGRFTTPEGAVLHSTIKIGDAALELGDAVGPYQPMPSMFYMYVPDADAVYRQAIAAGATSLAEPMDKEYGDRVGAVKDPFGNDWHIATFLGD